MTRPSSARLVASAVAVLSSVALGQSTPMAESIVDAPGELAPRYRVTVGAAAGLPHPVALQTVGSLLEAGQPRYALDLKWEPSRQLQSYSLGASWHVLDAPAFIGARVRWLQWRSPLAGDFRLDVDSDLGLGVEAGIRWPLGFARQFLVTASVGATAVPFGRAPLQALLHLNLGLAWTAWSK